MATSHFSNINRISLFITVISIVICSLEDFANGEESHTIQVVSLLPSANCTSNAAGVGKKSLQVVHRHGACSKETEGSTMNHTLILLQDQARVKSIQSRLSNKKTIDGISDSKVNLTAKSGISIGTGNYIVTIGLGTPKKDLTLIFDTGSSLTWTQCQPCVGSCYRQVDPIFDPTQSSSYINISCTSPSCSSLSELCLGTTCAYSITYVDQSHSIGYLATETLTLSPNDIIADFIFGCGEDNDGTFAGASGLIGLSRHRRSLVSQTSSLYDEYFSYCLPASSSGSGFLSFGKTDGPSSTTLGFTPITTVPQSPTFYGLELLGINVGGTQLSIPSTVFSTAGTIIDSGTVITRLPPTAYQQLKSTFQQMMSDYPTAPAVSILDTCYDFTGFSTVTIPRVIFSFSGNVNVDLDSNGILYVIDLSQVCLAFAANSLDTELGIYGNVQQKTFEVAYDVAGGQIGFGPNGC